MTIEATHSLQSSSEILERLSSIVGIKGIITDTGDLLPYCEEPRGLYHGAARCVVSPASVEEMSELLKLCNKHNIGVVPQGGNTGLVGGQTPDASGQQIVISLKRMAKIREIDSESNTLTVEAGVTLFQAQNAATSVNRYFPLSYASEGSATIGGALATNSGGIHVINYGSAGDLCLGVEAVLADGRIFSGLSKLRKDNTGYKLSSLIIGSEGTLGVITAATLKLFPRPCGYETGFVALENTESALLFLELAKNFFGPSLHAIELIPRLAIDILLKNGFNIKDPFPIKHHWYIIIEGSNFQQEESDSMISLLSEAQERSIISNAVLAKSHDQRQALWRIRELIPEAEKKEGKSVKHDLSIPINLIPDFLIKAEAVVSKYSAHAASLAFGHLGDGNIHYNVIFSNKLDESESEINTIDLSERIYQIVMECKGSLSAEHGIGQLKRDLLMRIKPSTDIEIMHKIKMALDPNWILNPQKIIQRKECQ